MALNPIINKPADQGGDALPTGWDKANAMFAELYGGALNVSSFKNLFINGGFDWWQRGTALAAYNAATKYLADRWKTTANGSTIAVSQQSFAPGQSSVLGGPQFFHRCVVASVANAANYALMTQTVEDLEQFSGQTCTLSFWAKADTARSIGIELAKGYGTGTGASPADFAVAKTTINLTAAWQKFIFTFVIPSNAGKTIAGGNDGLSVNFWLDCGSNFTARGSIIQQSGTFDMAQMQLELASTATVFENRPRQQELAMCQRFCLPIPLTGIRAMSLSNTTLLIGAQWPATMRAAPTATLLKTSFSAAAFELIVGTTWTNGTGCALSGAQITPTGFTSQLTGFSGMTAGLAAQFNNTSPFLLLDAEI